MKQADIKSLLQQRAHFLSCIRQFMAVRNVTEVDTRSLDLHSVTDPYMSAYQVSNSTGKFVGYLQTSPEYAMKRLLSRGSGDIFQLGKSFRADERGKHHDGEFTMLEWYRIDFEIETLIDEVYQLVNQLVGQCNKVVVTYRDAFIQQLDFDPFLISDDELAHIANQLLTSIPEGLLRDNYLTLLFSELIEPSFEQECLIFVTHYPASQASLAKVVEQQGFKVAERFEAYYGGVELANGFHELTDPIEQKLRFEEDNKIRAQLDLPEINIDFRLIEALTQGLPECSGVALGVDRLLMTKLKAKHIADVLPLGGLCDEL